MRFRLALVVAVAILAPLAFSQAIGRLGGQAQCQQNLKQIANACIQYAADNRGGLPADFTALKTYLPDKSVLVCLLAKDDTKPSYELVLKGKLDKVQDKAGTVMVREIDPNHNGHRMVAFADGHVDSQEAPTTKK